MHDTVQTRMAKWWVRRSIFDPGTDIMELHQGSRLCRCLMMHTALMSSYIIPLVIVLSNSRLYYFYKYVFIIQVYTLFHNTGIYTISLCTYNIKSLANWYHILHVTRSQRSNNSLVSHRIRVSVGVKGQLIDLSEQLVFKVHEDAVRVTPRLPGALSQ